MYGNVYYILYMNILYILLHLIASPPRILIVYYTYYSTQQEQSTLESWNKTAWAKKLANKKTRKSLSDFDRFKVMIAKKQKSKIIAEKLAAL